ncbi:MAG: hypothetical protein AB7S80_00110 [Rhizobiaceae bacterium]
MAMPFSYPSQPRVGNIGAAAIHRKAGVLSTQTAVARQNVHQGIVGTKWLDCRKRSGSGIDGWSGQMIDRIGLICE